MDKTRNYFKEACEFVRNPEINFHNLSEKLTEYFNENKFEFNERHLFAYHVEGQISLMLTIAKLKSEIE